jgi:S-DNA-T family DNA segregation ATPase FtsK/SpoIIIE
VSGPRDVDRIVAATREASHLLAIAEPRSPWLPPLPHVLEIGGLVDSATASRVPLGLEDDPSLQAQRPWSWSSADGHLGIAGGPRSGRTTAMLTVAGQLAATLSPKDVHLYAIGPSTLDALLVLPHVAAVADVDDLEHVQLVVERLTGVARSRTTSTARTVVLVDGWERLAGHAHGALAAELRSLLERPAGCGLRAVVTGGRSVLAGQLASVLGQRLLLALDPVELAVAGIPAKSVPARQPPGRALDARSHREVQVATIGDDSAGAFRALAERWSGSTTTNGWPRPVQRLPEHVSLSAPCGPLLVAVGVRDGDLEATGFRPSVGDRRILVQGPPGSGRTTALDTITAGLVAAGFPVEVLGADEVRDRLIEKRRSHPNLAVVVDDVERLSGSPVEPVLLEIARRVDEDLGVVVAATSAHALEGRASALAVELARAHTGVVLWPSPTTARSPAAIAAGGPTVRIPGRGLLLTSRSVERIQVATVSRP